MFMEHTELVMMKRAGAPFEATTVGKPRNVAVADFARNLQREMLRKGWHQSELARAASKFMPKGEEMGRDNISKYVRAKTVPGPIHLNALARALGVDPDVLLPDRGIPNLAAAENPPFDMRQLPDGNMWLRVNQAVDKTTAMKIMQLLNSADAKK